MTTSIGKFDTAFDDNVSEKIDNFQYCFDNQGSPSSPTLQLIK